MLEQSDCVSDYVPNTIWTGYLKPLNVNVQDLRSGKGGVDKGRGVTTGMSNYYHFQTHGLPKGQVPKINKSQCVMQSKTGKALEP